ncbi:MAG TPA: hypothetical protein VFT45_19595 [Longimicrobium sp.]|nr:hypothetical protein [Longimicrobium sp.]
MSRRGKVLWMCGAGFVLLQLLLMHSCTPPGKGPRAERGYRLAAPVIDALERYMNDHAAYPDSLPQLVPAYLPAAALHGPEPGEPLEYHRTEGGYDLTFRYVGPGMNECTWTPMRRSWDCSGYF